MWTAEIFDRFLKEAPACVMARATLERMFAPEVIDKLFQEQSDQQYCRELLFSTVVELMSLAVCRVHPSIHAAYQHRKDDISVSVKSLYNKLNAMEPQVSRSLVRHSAGVATELIDRLGERTPLLCGYRLKVLDGNHLTGTDHRLEVLREEGGAALPGVAVAVFDHSRGVFEDIVLAEDAYTQETQLLDPIIEGLGPQDLLLADRLYCTSKLLFATATQQAFFLIRQHLGHLRWKLKGRRRSAGRIETGKVSEREVELTDPQTGQTMQVRRISVVLDEPTRDGDEELHVLTNLPADQVSALQVASLYRDRWSVETAFQEMTTHLRCELTSLGHPAAALFTFCVAAACYNAFAVIHAALRNAHGEEEVDENVSNYYLTEEISSTYRGLMIVLPPEDWTEFQNLTPGRFAQRLQRWAKMMKLSRYQKHRRGPKQRTQREYSPTKHVSTARLLQQARSPT